MKPSFATELTSANREVHCKRSVVLPTRSSSSPSPFLKSPRDNCIVFLLQLEIGRKSGRSCNKRRTTVSVGMFTHGRETGGPHLALMYVAARSCNQDASKNLPASSGLPLTLKSLDTPRFGTFTFGLVTVAQTIFLIVGRACEAVLLPPSPSICCVVVRRHSKFAPDVARPKIARVPCSSKGVSPVEAVSARWVMRLHTRAQSAKLFRHKLVRGLHL